MSSGTLSVTPVGVNTGTPDIFKTIGSKLKKARDNAAASRKFADERIAALKKQDEEGTIDQEGIIELANLEKKRSEKGYFFKKSLSFEAKDKIRTAVGAFQRDPTTQYDPAATEKERFKVHAGLLRPGEMPDTSGREVKGQGMIGVFGKGFQMMMDAIDKIKSRVNTTTEATSSTASSASNIANSTQSAQKSSENIENITQSIDSTSKQEVNIQNQELNFAQDAANDKEKADAEAAAEQQKNGGEEGISVNAVDQGPTNFFGGLKNIVKFIRGLGSRGRTGRSGLSGVGSRGRTGSIQGQKAYTAPIGPQPMNSSTPWAARGAGERSGMYGQGQYSPRLESEAIQSGTTNLSNGAIIAPRMLTNPTTINKLSDGGIKQTGSSAATASAAVIPTQRPSGKKLLSGDKSDTENIIKVFRDIPSILAVGGVLSTMKAFSPILSTLAPFIKPVIKPLIGAFGFPIGVLDLLFGGSAEAATQGGEQTTGGLGTQPLSPGIGQTINPGAGTAGDRSTGGDGSYTGPSMTATGGSTVTQANISRGFRVRDGVGSGNSASGHTGLDIAGRGFERGTPISFLPPGEVIDVGIMGDANDPDGTNGGYGNFVVVRTDSGSVVKMAHLDSISVSKGEKVGRKPDGKAKVIGKLGDTGLSTGPHLHLDLGTGYNSGSASVTGLMDPMPYVNDLIRGGGDVKVEETPTAVSQTPQQSQLRAVTDGIFKWDPGSSTAAPSVRGKPSTNGGSPAIQAIIDQNNRSYQQQTQGPQITGTNPWSTTPGNALTLPYTNTWMR